MGNSALTLKDLSVMSLAEILKSNLQNWKVFTVYEGHPSWAEFSALK
jgi:preprotein translocase subunit Sss1